MNPVSALGCVLDIIVKKNIYDYYYYYIVYNIIKLNRRVQNK